MRCRRCRSAACERDRSGRSLRPCGPAGPAGPAGPLPDEEIVSPFPFGASVTLAPALRVTEPLRPLRLVTPAMPLPRRELLKDISKADGSLLTFVAWVP